MRFPVALLSALLLASSLPAAAASGPSTRPVYNPDGSFGFCLADYGYDDGRKLTFALSPNNQMNIGTTIPGGNFKQGGRYDLSFILDPSKPRKVRAEALDDETLLLQMGANPTLRPQLLANKSLSIGAKGREVAFDLPDMKSLLAGLDQCLQTKSKAPPAKQQAPAVQSSSLPAPLQALLEKAGFTDIVVMNMDEIPAEERPADYIWKTGSLMAGLREREVPQDKSLSDLIGLHLQGLKEKCMGHYNASVGNEQKNKDMTLRVAEATCGPKLGDQSKAIIVTLVLYTTPDGKFVVFTHEAPAPMKKEALAARDKLAKSLLK